MQPLQQQGKKSNIGYKDFERINVLGKGAYAKVFLVKKISDGQVYAMKILKKKRMQDQKQNILAEKNILIECDHQFIIKLKWSFQTQDKLFFVLDFVQGGELYNLISKFKKFSEDVCKFYSSQIVLAIQYLHSKDIIYRDLKPENVLIDNEGYLKLTDFGVSKRNIKNEHDAKSLAGTPEYFAPEVLTKDGYGKAIDYWALGCILYEMFTGDPPYQPNYTNNYVQDRAQILEQIKNYPVQLPQNASPQFQDLLMGLFEKDPTKRLGSDPQKGDIKQHPWFANVKWDELLKKNLKVPWKPKVTDQTDIKHFPVDPQDQNISSVQDSSTLDKVHLDDFTYDHNQLVSPQNYSFKENQGLKMQEEYEQANNNNNDNQMDIE